jgi:hypothetical protein
MAPASRGEGNGLCQSKDSPAMKTRDDLVLAIRGWSRHRLAMRRLSHQLIGLAFMGLLALALATGFAARPVPSEMELRLDAWLMAGLPLDDLCSDHGIDGHDKDHCPLCNLTAPSGLPPFASPLIDADQRIMARIVLPQMRRAAGHARDPAVPKRGPPALT